MYKNLLLGALILIMCPGLAFADSLQIGFNDSTAQVEAIVPTQRDSYGYSEVNLRGLYNEKTDTRIASLGFDVLGSLNDQIAGIYFGAGVKVYGGKAVEDDILSMGLGGIFKIAPPSWQGLGITASYFYSPQIFTALDATRMSEFQTAVTFEFIPRKARVFVSYNNIHTDFETTANRTIDESVRLGISLGY